MISILILSGLLWSGDPCVAHAAYARSFEESWLAHEVVVTPFPGTAGDAEKVRDCLLGALRPHMGAPVGYKAAFTAEGARKRFGLDAPLLGVLLEKMLLSESETVPHGFAAIPLIEADLIAIVADEAINDAKTGEEAMGHIGGLMPFIEFPDMVFGREVTLDKAHLLLANAGARLGVYGKTIPFKADAYEALGKVRVQLIGPNQQILAEGATAALLGHPGNAVLWIRDAVLKRGGKLGKGDLLSLGSVTMPMPLKTSGTITARYHGLSGKNPVDLTITIAPKP